MPEFTAKDVQALRRATGAGMLDAKRALEETGGDVEGARRWLREQGLASSGRRSDRPSSQGAVSVVVDGPGAIVELRCETDFVAKSAEFVRLVEELTQLVADLTRRAQSALPTPLTRNTRGTRTAGPVISRTGRRCCKNAAAAVTRRRTVKTAISRSPNHWTLPRR